MFACELHVKCSDELNIDQFVRPPASARDFGGLVRKALGDD
jgi:hypothetical protein